MVDLKQYPHIKEFEKSIISIEKKDSHWEIVFNPKVERACSSARTLEPSPGFDESTGWTVIGEVHEDYYKWINDFEAYKGKECYVKGDFENIIETSSLKALDVFLSHYTVNEWDYYDI